MIALLLAAQVLLPWDPPPAPPRLAPTQAEPLEPLSRLSFGARGGMVLGLAGGLDGVWAGATATWQSRLWGDSLLFEVEAAGTRGEASGVIQDRGFTYAYGLSRNALVLLGSAQVRRVVAGGLEIHLSAGLDYSVAQLQAAYAGRAYSLLDLQPGAHLGAGVDIDLFVGTVVLDARIIVTRMTLLGDPDPVALATITAGYTLWF